MIFTHVRILPAVARSLPESDTVVAAAVDPDKTIRIARFFSYPKQALYLLASFIVLISLCHFASLIYKYAIRRRALLPSQPRSKVSLRRVPLAISDTFRALAFRWEVPIGSSYTLNLTEVFLTAAYIGVLFTWTLINTTTTTGIIVEPHYYANRAATMAASQLPIMTALGMRNNIFSLLTGVSYDKINYLHRMSARVLCVLVWIHGAGRLVVGLVDDEAIVNRWVQCGFLAASSLTVLCFTTIRPIRERSYEVFLMIHFLLVFVFLLSIYFHLTGRSLTYYGAWPSFIVWGLDRFIRLVRIVLFNFGYFKPKSPNSKALGATVDVLSPQFLRITLNRSNRFNWLPGQSAYLSFPEVSTFPFESHPFTISTISEPEGQSEKQLVFLVRVRDGFTRRLLNKASSDRSFKVFLNGPYSSPPLLIGYQTVILIAGGSGVAFTLPLFLDLLRQAISSSTFPNILTSCVVVQKEISLNARKLCSSGPSEKQASHVQWIADSLSPALQGVPSTVAVDVQLFITTSGDDTQVWEDDSVSENDTEGKAPSSASDPKILESPFVRVQQGRPDLQNLIKQEIASSSGAISINVCGTRALASATRTAIRAPRPVDVLRGGPTVTLHVEAFGSG